MLAAVGIYGVLAQLVTLRTREIGVRVALGASQGQVLGLVFSQAMSTVCAGVGLGLIVATVVSRWLTSMLFGISATDPITFAGAALLLAAVAVVATLVPAHRAANLDPTVALRAE